MLLKMLLVDFESSGGRLELRILLLFLLLLSMAVLFVLYRLYPLKYYDIVLLHAGKLDPLLIMSVMRAESSFRKDAVSVVGAYGLMQVRPETAAWLNRRFGKNYDYKIPEDNIALGCLYLNYLLERDGDLRTALVHYNTGPYAEQTVKEDAGNRYIARVFRNYRFYRFLYRR